MFLRFSPIPSQSPYRVSKNLANFDVASLFVKCQNSIHKTCFFLQIFSQWIDYQLNWLSGSYTDLHSFYNFLENKNSAGCPPKTKWPMKICISEAHKFFRQITTFNYRTSFHQLHCFQNAASIIFCPQKNHQMKAGQCSNASATPIGQTGLEMG